MIYAFLTGFILGFSLILAIGAQNSFVLRQGLIGRHVFIVALFCALSDALLIIIGVAGISIFLNYIDLVSDWLFGISAIWLAGYGLLRLRDAVIGKSVLIAENSSVNGLASTLSFLVVLTFANPHVYLDTVVLIGSVSQQFPDNNTKLSYVLGASIASFVFFFSLAYGAKFLSPVMQRPIAWRLLDSFIAFVMFGLAIKMTYIAGWF